MGLLRRVKSLLAGGRVDVAGRFELLREAVHGTMSNFYQARDRQSGQTVGLKVLDPEKTKAFEARFTGLDKPCEGAIAIALAHPRIVTTFEHGVTTRNEQFLVMEFLAGQGLNTLILNDRERLEGQRLTLLRQAAEATAAVHDAGFIHRDICPRNFVVAPDGDSLKLIDFGLSVPNQPPYRRPGNRTGTPRYMAPEVVRRRPTDHRLDIFSFGVTAYEVFAFDSPWPASVTSGKVAMEHDKPSVPLVECCERIDPVLARAIHGCLSASPDERPGSMREFLQEIRGIEQETLD